MATRSLVKGSTDLSQTASWSGATVPVDGDAVRLQDSGADVTAGLDMSAVTLTDIDESAGFSGDIGGPSGSWQIDVTSTGGTKTYRKGGSGTVYWSGDADMVKAQSGVLHITGGTIGTLEVDGNAIVYVGESAVITNVRTTGKGSPNVIAAFNATAFTTVQIRAGSMTTKRSIATATTDGRGLLILEDAAAVTTKLNIVGLSLVRDRSSGTIADLEKTPYAGYDATGRKQDKTITASTVWAGPGIWQPRAYGTTTNVDGDGGAGDTTFVGLPDGGLMVE